MAIESNNKVGAVYNKMKNSISNLLKHGKLEPGQSGHNLLFHLANELYQLKDSIFDIVADTYTSIIGQSSKDIDQTQRLMVIDLNVCYPVDIKLNFDLTTFVGIKQQYRIDRKIEIIDQQSFTEQFYALRRKGLLKTVATVIDK